MSTPSDLASLGGPLLGYKLSDTDDRQPLRQLFLAPDVAAWIGQLPSAVLRAGRQREGHLSPKEQVRFALDNFVAGGRVFGATSSR